MRGLGDLFGKPRFFCQMTVRDDAPSGGGMGKRSSRPLATIACPCC